MDEAAAAHVMQWGFWISRVASGTRSPGDLFSLEVTSFPLGLVMQLDTVSPKCVTVRPAYYMFPPL